MQIQLYQTKVFQNLCLVPTILQSDIFYIYESWACPTNGSDCGSLHSHNLTLFVRQSMVYLPPGILHP